MKISAKQRREAIEACDQMTSDRAGTNAIDQLEDIVDDAAVLALVDEAFVAVDCEAHVGDANYLAMQWAEAAALLRGDDDHEPWSPGDPIYLRTKQGA